MSFGGPRVPCLLRHPDPAVVAEALAHEGELRLVPARDRDAGRVDLREAGIAEKRPALVRAPDRGRVAGLRVGREVEHVAVPAGRQDDGVARVRFELPVHHVPRDDAARAPVDQHQVEHFAPREELHPAPLDFLRERLVGADQELLAGLPPGVERARHLRPAEGAVVEQPAVLAGERDALRDALVDDVAAHLREAVDVRLPAPGSPRPSPCRRKAARSESPSFL